MTDTIGHVPAKTAVQEQVAPAIDEQSVAEQMVAQIQVKGIALAWLVHDPNPVTLPGAKSALQLEENAAAADLSLAGAEVAHLTAGADRVRPGRHPREQARGAATPAKERIRQLVRGDGGTAAKSRGRS
jgi:diketogulonate reductase-like aldo/keto reductase